MEAKNTHTPGPWFVIHDAPDRGSRFPKATIRNLVVDATRRESGAVAEIAAPGGPGWDERCDANARLIAAAPALLAALEAMAAYAECEQAVLDHMKHNDYDKVEAALGKYGWTRGDKRMSFVDDMRARALTLAGPALLLAKSPTVKESK